MVITLIVCHSDTRNDQLRTAIARAAFGLEAGDEKNFYPVTYIETPNVYLCI